ncbi:MAG: hypothetical protein ACKVJK_17255 [Methylophagaceae bacterium]
MSGGATISFTGRGRVGYSAPYTVPAVNGTTLNYSCSGGDYRIYATSNKYGGLQGLSQRDFLGVTRPGTLNDLGPDFIYTSFVTGTPIASVSITSAYGDISAQVSFTQIGSVELWRSTYAGHWRTAEGGQVSRGGQSTRNFFTTKDPSPPPPPPTTPPPTTPPPTPPPTTPPPPPPPPPPPVYPGRIAVFSVPSYPNAKGQADLRWTDGSATYQTLRSTFMGGGDNKTVCVDPSETGFNQGWYGVVYYPSIHGVITLSVSLTPTPCQ